MFFRCHYNFFTYLCNNRSNGIIQFRVLLKQNNCYFFEILIE